MWTATLDELRPQVTRPTYETWLAKTHGVAVADGRLVVGCPNAFVAEMLEQRVRGIADNSLREHGLAVRFEVSGGGAPPREEPEQPEVARPTFTPPTADEVMAALRDYEGYHDWTYPRAAVKHYTILYPWEFRSALAEWQKAKGEGGSSRY